MANKDLKQFYDSIYLQGKQKFFSKFANNKNISETDQIILSTIDWDGKNVLDVGCGTGTTSYLISQNGAIEVIGIDYSGEAISIAKNTYQSENLQFYEANLCDWSKKADIIISCGTLEHLDEPGEMLRKMSNLLLPGGTILITCPYFQNIRGFIWMTLQTLLNVPMSLTDLHFISSFDIESWLEGTSLQLVNVRTFDYDWGNGDHMLVDLRKRLTNALRDASLDNSKVNDFIDWLEKGVQYRQENQINGLEGATALYIIHKAQ
jgi:2-polyprenyl-3-methyl-5-hydroxy-6-metoxy-1,4-benzoquinol methylase